MNNLCPQCGAPAANGATHCQYCGAAIVAAQPQPQPQYQPQPQPTYPQPAYPNYPASPAVNPAWPVKSKVVAGVLALLLGSIGVHKFYLGKVAHGILMLLFCWTYIPGIIALIDGIMILTSSDENFQQKYQCRIQ